MYGCCACLRRALCTRRAGGVGVIKAVKRAVIWFFSPLLLQSCFRNTSVTLSLISTLLVPELFEAGMKKKLTAGSNFNVLLYHKTPT